MRFVLKELVIGIFKNKQIAKNIFEVSPYLNELGESPLWHEELQTLLWIDILSNRLFSKNMITNEISFWGLPNTISTMSIDKFDKNILWLLSEKALVQFNLSNNQYFEKFPIDLGAGYRTNDGHVGPDGKFWFGTMNRNPNLGKGKVFTIDRARNLELMLENISIPNTFCWLKDKKLIISDSFLQKSYIWDESNILNKKNEFIDLSGTTSTPDGGAVDNNNNIWIAIWGGNAIVCYSSKSKQLDKISLPVLQPSSCCFGGKNNQTLFITTAREGMSDNNLKLYPHSGKVLGIKLPVSGAPVKYFSME